MLLAHAEASREAALEEHLYVEAWVPHHFVGVVFELQFAGRNELEAQFAPAFRVVENLEDRHAPPSNAASTASRS
ncbi:hypothetical protein CMI47_02875 [Candidatus Pacearchaeota archaeon]|nr:hypothetical protein [Candidatus Pacearchaeota archaeon]